MTTSPSPTNTCPALLVAAPSSGQGKTTVVAALARHWSRQGKRVQVFKCGPDFIDAGWHQLASGQPVYQLDLWMVGADACRAMLQHACTHNDMVLVEGVMGLFDGQPSSADLAAQFGLPVVAVVDASRMAGTLGALVYGLQHYQTGLPWAGVLANRVASAGHSKMLQQSLREPEHWLGAVASNSAFSLGSRHLGLLQAHELDDALQRLDAAADALAETSLAALSAAELQRFAPMWQITQGSCNKSSANASSGVLSHYLHTQTRTLQGRTIAVARDAACCFIYQANLDTLHALGAKLVFFSPLADAALPACDALWLPGGYPELHLPQLASNTAMRASVQEHVAAGKPVWAECGGLMLLCQDILAAAPDASATQAASDAISSKAWGILPAKVQMHKRLQGLGPQALALPHIQQPDSIPALRGHTFHYSSICTDLPELTRTTSPRANSRSQAGEALYQYGPAGNVWASYFHPWFASSPQAAAHLFLPHQ